MDKLKNWLWILVASLGALFNRIRGGLWDIPGGKIIYPIWIGFLAWNPLIALCCYAGQQICGWGAYAGAACSGVEKEQGDSKFIDWIIAFAQGKPWLWGCFGMTSRGIIWMLPMAWLDSLLIFVGALMGGIYVSWGLTFKNTKWRYTKLAWNLSEWTWGLVQSLAVWGTAGAGSQWTWLG